MSQTELLEVALSHVDYLELTVSGGAVQRG